MAYNIIWGLSFTEKNNKVFCSSKQPQRLYTYYCACYSYSSMTGFQLSGLEALLMLEDF